MPASTQSEFNDAVARYIRADNELAAAGNALRALLTRRALAASEVKKGLLAESPRPGVLRLIDLATIQKSVAEHYGLNPTAMQSKARPNHIAHPRQVAMFLARELTKHSLEEIGAAFGGRDHGTVIHAGNAISDRAQLDADFRAELEQIRTDVRSALGLPEAAHA